jgi:undecaprenyl phosphate-alpha-L-ara4N flippase subunit ArnE
MTLRDLSLILATVFSLAIGQICFKLAAPAFSNFSIKSLFEPIFIVALVVYAVATVLWVICLSRVPLTLAYPIVALSYIIVPLLAKVFLGESLSMHSFIGAAVIIAGVYISIYDKM